MNFFEDLSITLTNRGYLTRSEWLQLFDRLPFNPLAAFQKGYFKQVLTPGDFLTVPDFHRLMYSIIYTNSVSNIVSGCKTCGDMYVNLVTVLTTYASAPIIVLKDRLDNPIFNLTTVGVFNVNNEFLGDANIPSSIVSLWNADTANSSIGYISQVSGHPTAFYFTAYGSNIPDKIIAHRKYSFDAKGIGYVYGNEYTYLRGEPIADEGFMINTSNDSTAEIYNAYVVDDGSSFYKYNFISSNTDFKTIHVYFCENDKYCGFNKRNDTTPVITNLLGEFPENAIVVYLYAHNPHSANIRTSNIANWSKLKNVAAFIFESQADGTTQYITAAEMDISNLGLLQTLIVKGYSGSLDALGLNKLKYPFLKVLQIINSNYQGSSTILPFTASNCPPCSSNIDFSGAGLTSTAVDNILIGLASALQNVKPFNYNLGTNITIVSGNAVRTSASNAAVAKLNSYGWTIN